VAAAPTELWGSAASPRRGTQLDAALRRSPLFANLDEQAISALRGEMVISSVPSGEVVLRQGDIADCLYLVVSGRVRVVTGPPEARTVLAELGPGQIFGEMGLLTGEPRYATVETARDSELARLGATSFHRVIERYPELMVRSLSRTVIDRLQHEPRTPSSAASIATVAVFGALGDEDLDRAAARLSEAFGTLGRTARLTSCAVDDELGQPGIAQLTDEASPARAR
jgi:NTE family protein